jgi:hypothetical protein
MFRVRVRATDGLVNVVGGPWSILQKRPETVSGCFQAPLYLRIGLRGVLGQLWSTDGHPAVLGDVQPAPALPVVRVLGS